MGSRKYRICCLCKSRFVIRIALVTVVLLWACIFYMNRSIFNKKQEPVFDQRGLEDLLNQPRAAEAKKTQVSIYISDPVSHAEVNTSVKRISSIKTFSKSEPFKRTDNVKDGHQKKTNESHTERTSDRGGCHDDFQKEFEENKQYLCTHLYGGIGNYMFAFASVYGMAKAVNKTVVLHVENPLLKYFKVKAVVIKDFCICLNVKVVDEGKSGVFNKELMTLTGRRNYRPSLYLQSWKYFRDVEDDIREQFTFRGAVLDIALQRIQEKITIFNKITNMTSKPEITVGVHVRKGDITEKKKFLDFGYQIAPPKYFERAMTYFRKKFDSPLFLVCSDDIKWCKEKITGSDVMYMEDNSFAVDMAILTHCHHTIISVGSFGWWAGYLSPGKTVYYKHPVKEGSVLMSQFPEGFNDYFYPDWIGME